MKLKILDKNAHWWSREKCVKWATQDRDGNWWLINGSEFPEQKVNKNMDIKLKRSGQHSVRPSTNFFLLILLSSLLGVSLAINLIFILKLV